MAYVLVVDDDEDFSTAIATAVRAAGHDVVIQPSTKKAAQSIEKHRPDLVILDVMFPENDSAGFEFARDLARANEEKKKIPVLMLTAINTKTPVGFSEHDTDDTWLPVDDFLEKPVDLNNLMTRVNRLLEKRAS